MEHPPLQDGEDCPVQSTPQGHCRLLSLWVRRKGRDGMEGEEGEEESRCGKASERLSTIVRHLEKGRWEVGQGPEAHCGVGQLGRVCARAALVEGRGQAKGEIGMASIDLKRPELLLSQVKAHTYAAMEQQKQH